MALTLLNLTTGQQTTITDSTSLESAILAVKTSCNQYSDQGDTSTRLLAKNYSDSLAAKLAKDLAVIIPETSAIMPQSLQMSVGSQAFSLKKDNSTGEYLGSLYNGIALLDAKRSKVYLYQDQDALNLGKTNNHSNGYKDFFDNTNIIEDSITIPKTSSNLLTGCSISYVDDNTYQITTPVILTLRDESYINAVGIAAKVYSLRLITDLQTDLNNLAVNSATQALSSAKDYVDLKAINFADKTYVDNHKWLFSSISDIAKFAKNERDITNAYMQSLQDQVDQILVEAFTLDKFEEYLIATEDDFYPKKLNQTVTIEQGMQKFKGVNRNIDIEFINHYQVKDGEDSTLKIVAHDCNHNGYALEYTGHNLNNLNANNMVLYALKNHKIADKILSVQLSGTPSATFNTRLNALANGIISEVATQKWVQDLLADGVDVATLDAIKQNLTALINTKYNLIVSVDLESAKNDCKNYTDQKFNAIPTIDVSQTYVDSRDTATLNSAKTYAQTQDIELLKTSKAYADQMKIDSNIYAKNYADSLTFPSYVPFLFGFNPIGTYSTESGTNGSWAISPGKYLICNGTTFDTAKYSNYNKFLIITGQASGKTPNIPSPHPNYKYIVKVA